jgi:beta-lactamase class A
LKLFKFLFVLILCTQAHAQTKPTLDSLVKSAADQAIEKFEAQKLKADDFAITLIDMRDPQNPSTGSHRGDVGMYPASVIKLFYMVAAHRWMEDGKLKDSPQVQKTMRAMIVDSDNDATGQFVDWLSETKTGTTLPADEMKAWAAKRNRVNEYFKSLGYTGINVAQRTYAETGPMGREREFLGANYEHRNKLTTDATARLLCEIVQRKAVSEKRSEEMLKLLARDMSDKGKGPDDQAHGFTALAFSPQDKLWSKAGWTNSDRHDAAYVETADGLKFILVTFTRGHAKEREIIPSIAKSIMTGLREMK